MAVTKEQIFSAADNLAAAGQKPTLEAIRQITGGSYTTISPALNEWKARQATAAAPLREPAPQAVADRVAELGSDLWTIALDLANARLAVEREGSENLWGAARFAYCNGCICLADVSYELFAAYHEAHSVGGTVAAIRFGIQGQFGGSGSCRARLQEQEFPSSLEGHWRNISGRKIRDITQGIDLASIEATCGIC